MKRNLNIKIAIAALGLFVASESFAGGKPPWKVPEKGITEAQHLIVADLKKALAVEHRTQPFYKSARRIRWSTSKRNYGISNIDANNINKLFSGHYFVAVYRPPGNKKISQYPKNFRHILWKRWEVFKMLVTAGWRKQYTQWHMEAQQKHNGLRGVEHG